MSSHDAIYHHRQISFFMHPDPQAASHRKTAIAPLLNVRNGAKAIEFYRAAFGAEELFRVDDDTGAVVAQLSVAELGTIPFPFLLSTLSCLLSRRIRPA